MTRLNDRANPMRRPQIPDAERREMELQLRIWGASLIFLGLLGLVGLDLLQFPSGILDPLWSVVAICLGLISFWFRHSALLVVYAVLLGIQGVLLAVGGFGLGGEFGTIILAMGVLLVVYGLRLWGAFRHVRALPAEAADGFALAGIAAALLAAVLGAVAFAVATSLHFTFVRYGLDLATLALGLSLGAYLSPTERPGIDKIGLGLALLVLVALLAVLVFYQGQ